MPNLRKAWIVTRFELAEALRSRLVVLVLLVYGAGAAAGSWAFLKALNAAMEAMNHASGGILEGAGSALAREQRMRAAVSETIASFVSDRALGERLLRMDPLAIFYGFVALNVVAVLVFSTSAAPHAADRESGAIRFVLPRCDRLSWAFGKMLGHALLLAMGLVMGAFSTAAVALGMGWNVGPTTVGWLLVTASWAWLYGFSYLGIFSGVALAAHNPARARLFGFIVLCLLWLAHALAGASFLTESWPGLAHLVWLFPDQYQSLLWSFQTGPFLLASTALLAIGLACFWAGERVFRRSDA